MNYKLTLSCRLYECCSHLAVEFSLFSFINIMILINILRTGWTSKQISSINLLQQTSTMATGLRRNCELLRHKPKDMLQKKNMAPEGKRQNTEAVRPERLQAEQLLQSQTDHTSGIRSRQRKVKGFISKLWIHLIYKRTYIH